MNEKCEKCVVLDAIESLLNHVSDEIHRLNFLIKQMNKNKSKQTYFCGRCERWVETSLVTDSLGYMVCRDCVRGMKKQKQKRKYL